MKELLKKIAYLEGLIDGAELEDAKVKRILDEIVDVLEDVVEALHDLRDEQEDLEDYVSCIDEDLEDLEKEIYGDEEEEDEEEEDEEEDEEDDDVSYVEVECPKCHDTVYFDSSILEDDDVVEVTCPNCDEVVFVNDDNINLSSSENSEQEDNKDEDI